MDYNSYPFKNRDVDKLTKKRNKLANKYDEKASKAIKKVRKASEKVAKVKKKAATSTGSKKSRLEKKAEKIYDKGSTQVEKFEMYHRMSKAATSKSKV